MSRIGLKFSQMILHTSTSKMMNNLPFLLVVLHKPTLWPSTFKFAHRKKHLINKHLKGKFPQTTMWIGWVESYFTNPTVKVWADLDKPFKRSDYAKLCMSPSLDGTLPEYVISQEDNWQTIDFVHV